MRSRFLTSASPNSELDLGGLKITPAERVSIKSKSHEQYHDSIFVESPNDDWNLLGQWVAFHAFTLGSRYTLTWYEEEDTSSSELVVHSDPSSYVVDYDDLLHEVLRTASEGHPKVSYKELYEEFIKIDELTLGLVKNSFNAFTGGVSNPKKNITDPTYWQLMVSFSIIEAIIGRQPYCSNKVDCEVCDKKQLPHNKQTTRDWTKSRLKAILDNEDRAEEYANIVMAVWTEIRNDTVHNSAFPTAELNLFEPGETEVFDANRSIDEFRTDQTALMSLLHMTHDISRFLLLDKIYGTKFFPALSPLMSVRVVIGESEAPGNDVTSDRA